MTLNKWIRRNIFIIGPGRQFSTSAFRFSGHNRWSKIKHDKGKNDAQKTKLRATLVKELEMASRLNGADPRFNPRLDTAITTAKQASFPKASIESAIARGQGVSASGAPLENLTIEAILPPSIAVIIEAQTESKARAMQDLRHIISNFGASATPTNFMFRRRGCIILNNSERKVTVDDVLEDVAEAGAEDVELDENDNLVIYTDPSQTNSITLDISKKLGLEIESTDIIWDPNNDTMIDLDENSSPKATKFLEELHEHPSVKEVYTNII